MSEILTGFIRECYHNVLEQFQNAETVPRPEPALVGSLCAVGHKDTAELLYEQGQSRLGSREREHCLYLFLCSSLQKRDVDSAKSYLGKLAQSHRSDGGAYFSLSFGQYHFYRGTLAVSLRYARRALEIALNDKDHLAMLLAHELMAGVQALRGARKAAQKHFAAAIGLCVKLERRKHGARLGQALQLCWIRQRPGRDHLSSLVHALEAVPLGKRFARASLLLELAKQEVSSGTLQRAEQRLEEVYEIIDGSAEPRFFAAYAMRQAEVAIARGLLRLALHHLDYANQVIDDQWDRLARLEFAVLRARIYDGLAMRDRWEHWEAVAEGLLRKTDAMMPVIMEVPSPKEHDAGPWNQRQRSIINYLKHNAFINVAHARTMFKVSDITACRDLSALTKAGVLERIGRARATQYRLSELN